MKWGMSRLYTEHMAAPLHAPPGMLQTIGCARCGPLGGSTSDSQKSCCYEGNGQGVQYPAVVHFT